jgi:hypothetical protein
MPTPRNRPGDVTGRTKAKLSEEHQEELVARAKEISLITAAEQAAKTEVVDLSGAVVATQPDDAPIEVDAQEKIVEIQVVENIDEMTYGAGNLYSFEAGRRYRVKAGLANHLAERGYVWGM